MTQDSTAQVPKPSEVLFYFLRLGSTAFGGPLSAVAMMQRDLVEKKKWLDDTEFNQAFTLIKAMPGPIAFMMSVFLGRRRCGVLGGFLSAVGFVFPSFLMIVALAKFYADFEKFVLVQNFLKGLQVSAFALIVLALKGLVQKDYLKIEFNIFAWLAAFLFWNSYLPEPLIIIGFGGIYALYKSHFSHELFGGLLMSTKIGSADEHFLNFTWTDQHLILFEKCLKAGALIFGTGFAILPVLRNDFVTQLHWISESEFLDALSFGQITPGPVVITGTYIGYKILGLYGASLATLGIFLPSFIHIQTWFPWAMRKLGRKTWVGHFLLAASAAVAGSIAITLIRVGQQVSWNLGLAAIFMVSLLAFLVFKKWPSFAILLAAGFAAVLVL